MTEFERIVRERRSVRKFDTQHNFDQEAVKRSLEIAILSPNSSNLQTWEFYRVISTEKKKEMAEACMNQGAARTASELVVFVSRIDLWKNRIKWHLKKNNTEPGKELSKREKRTLEYYGKQMPFFYNHSPAPFKTWFRKIIINIKSRQGKALMKWTTKSDVRVVSNKSLGIAAQTFMLAMQAEGYNTCPMEGFNADLVRKILNLPASADPAIVIGCGKGLPEGIIGDRERLDYDEVVFEV